MQEFSWRGLDVDLVRTCLEVLQSDSKGLYVDIGTNASESEHGKRNDIWLRTRAEALSVRRAVLPTRTGLKGLFQFQHRIPPVLRNDSQSVPLDEKLYNHE